MYYKGTKIARPMTLNSDFHGYGERIRTEIATRLPKKGARKVLDVGTGIGTTLGFLTNHLPQGSKIWTVDPSEEVLEDVRKKLAEEGAGSIPVEFVHADASSLDFEDGFFDEIISVMVLHHVEDLGDLLVELARVLKNGGRLLITDYLPEAPKYLDFRTRHVASDFYQPERVSKAVRQAGLKVRTKRFKLWYLVDAKK